jgi:hypothetical protein
MKRCEWAEPGRVLTFGRARAGGADSGVVAYARRMGDRQDRPARLRVFRDEAQDIVPLNFGPFLASARGRVEEDNAGTGEAETRAGNDTVVDEP